MLRSAVITVGTVFLINILCVNSDDSNSVLVRIKKEHLNKYIPGNIIYKLTLPGLHDCMRECLAVSLCKSVDYNQEVCILHDVDSKNKTLRTEAGSIFSEINEWPSFIVGSCSSRPCNATQKCFDTVYGFACLPLELNEEIEAETGK